MANSPISFEDYDRVTDTLMYLSDDLTLNFSVSLSRKLMNSNERKFFHWETMTGIDKYGSSKRSIKRNMNYSFIINCRSNFNAGIMLKPQDVEMLLIVIEKKILPWFFGNNKESAFQMVNDNLALKHFEPISYAQSEAKYMVFEPIIYSDNEKSTRGIRLTIQSGNSADMEIDTFMGFFNILKSDMYAVACSLINYAKIGPYGINVYNPSGLGAPPSEAINNWSNINENRGFMKNSFLDNAKIKEKE